jgi:hypothetical protein
VSVFLDVMRFHHIVARFGAMDISLLHGLSFAELPVLIPA